VADVIYLAGSLAGLDSSVSALNSLLTVISSQWH